MTRKHQQPPAEFLSGEYRAKDGESWSLHHAPMSRAYHRFLQARSRRPSNEVCSDDAAIEGELFAAAEDALRIYSRGRQQQPPWIFPHEIALFVADILSEIAVGGDPQIVRILRAARGRGAPTAAASELGNIATAVVYVKACREGLVPDSAPNKTVCRLYGVKPTTVRGWMQEKYRQELDPRRLQPPTGMEFADFVRSLLETSASAYRASARTRTASAIRKRG